jgi:hypothetical protein
MDLVVIGEVLGAGAAAMTGEAGADFEDIVSEWFIGVWLYMFLEYVLNMFRNFPEMFLRIS